MHDVEIEKEIVEMKKAEIINWVVEPGSKVEVGDKIADAYIIPQLYNGRRFEVDLPSVCPTLLKVEAIGLEHPWIQVSHPDEQLDAPPLQKKLKIGG